MKAILILLLMILIGCGDENSASYDLSKGQQSNVIYGENSFREADRIVSRSRQKSFADDLRRESVALMTKSSWENLKNKNEIMRVSELYNLDSEISWREQESFAYCSGVVIASDKVLTAAHCFKEHTCEDTVMVFGYWKGSSSVEAVECASLLNPKAVNPEALDYAVLTPAKRLTADKRTLKDLSKLPLSTASLYKGASLFMVGYPLGVLQKISTGRVRGEDVNLGIITNLDAFEGSSGSPVYNYRAQELIGILVSGENDFEFDPVLDAEKMKKCEESACAGEIVLPIKKVIDDLQKYL